MFHDGRQVQGDVVGRHRFVDLAVVHVIGGDQLKTLEFADSEQVRVGEGVVALGFPGGGARGTVNVTSGIVSAIPVIRDEVEYIQTDAAINPGNSGGPLINTGGQVVGINTYRPDETAGRPIENIGFAISSNFVRGWLPSLINGFELGYTSLTVAAGSTHPITFDVEAGTEIGYNWVANLDLDFGISDPAGNFIVLRSPVESAEGSVVAATSGRYTLIFGNTFSLFTAKNVRLVYRIIPAVN